MLKITIGGAEDRQQGDRGGDAQKRQDRPATIAKQVLDDQLAARHGSLQDAKKPKPGDVATNLSVG
jgi:hypothetical protein